VLNVIISFVFFLAIPSYFCLITLFMFRTPDFGAESPNLGDGLATKNIYRVGWNSLFFVSFGAHPETSNYFSRFPLEDFAVSSHAHEDGCSS
jgi:hypothetical protein